MLKALKLDCEHSPDNVAWVSVCKRGIAYIEPKLEAVRSACFSLVSGAGLSDEYTAIKKSSLARKGPLLLLQHGTRHFLVLYRCVPRLQYHEPQTQIERLIVDFHTQWFNIQPELIGGAAVGGAALAGLLSYGAYRGLHKKTRTMPELGTIGVDLESPTTIGRQTLDDESVSIPPIDPSHVEEGPNPNKRVDDSGEGQADIIESDASAVSLRLSKKHTDWLSSFMAAPSHPKQKIPIDRVDERFIRLFGQSVEKYRNLDYQSEKYRPNLDEMSKFIKQFKGQREVDLAKVLHLVHYVAYDEFIATLDDAVRKLATYCAAHNIVELTMGVFSKNDDFQATACVYPPDVQDSELDVSIQLMKSNLWVMALVYPRLLDLGIKVDFKKTENCTILLCDDILFKGQQMESTLDWYQAATYQDDVEFIVFSVYTTQMAIDKLAEKGNNTFVYGASIELTSDEKTDPGFVELQKGKGNPYLTRGYNALNDKGIENWYYFFHKMGDRRAVFEPDGFIPLVEWIRQEQLRGWRQEYTDQIRRIFPEPAPPYKDPTKNVFLEGDLCPKRL